MNKIIYAISAAVIILATTLIPMTANAMGPLFPMMQQMCARGLASSPQCQPLQNQLGQNTQTGSNPTNGGCPSGTFLQGTSCVTINGLLNNPANTAANTNPAVQTCTPSTQTISLPIAIAASQTITPLPGQIVVLDGSKSTGGVIQNNNCVGGVVGSATQTTGVVNSWNWVQTSGKPTVTLTCSTCVTATFAAPISNSSSALSFQLTVGDTSGLKSASAIVVVTLNPSAQ